MAAHRNNPRMPNNNIRPGNNPALLVVDNDNYDCPVCMETMMGQIFLCENGHSLCASCSESLGRHQSPQCPICRGKTTKARNFTLENIISKMSLPCDNKAAGCNYLMVAAKRKRHSEECFFRSQQCFFGINMGNCSWEGMVKDMYNHFEQQHSECCYLECNTDIELNDFDVKKNGKNLFIVRNNKNVFFVTLVINVGLDRAFFSVQLMSSAEQAKVCLYSIHITDSSEPRRNITVSEYCNPSSIKTENVINTGRCATLPLKLLETFMSNKVLIARLSIKFVGMNEDKDRKTQPNKFGGNKKGPGDSGTNREFKSLFTDSDVQKFRNNNNSRRMQGPRSNEG